MVAVRPHMGVFALYVGLTASGYNMVHRPEGDPIERLVKAIKTAEWPAPVRKYFVNAKGSAGGINPYWPRASMLLEACFYLQPGQSFEPADELALLRDIAKFPVALSEKDPTTVSWVRAYPAALSALVDTALFPKLWSSYLDAVQPTLGTFETAASATLESLTGMAGVRPETLPEIVVIPNPLQASELADFVRRRDTLYVVVAEPRTSSMIHELLHDIIGPALTANRLEISRHRHLLRPVLQAMMRMQYAWGDDDDSWMRVFEESMMRAAAIWLENERRSDEGERQAKNQAKQGFIYVPVLLNCLRRKWQGPDVTAGFVAECLRACLRVASRV